MRKKKPAGGTQETTQKPKLTGYLFTDATNYVVCEWCGAPIGRRCESHRGRYKYYPHWGRVLSFFKTDVYLQRDTKKMQSLRHGYLSGRFQDGWEGWSPDE
jgi:hypothetical protein